MRMVLQLMAVLGSRSFVVLLFVALTIAAVAFALSATVVDAASWCRRGTRC